MDKWAAGNFWQSPIIGIIFSITVVTVILLVVFGCYYAKVKKMDVKSYDSKLVIVMDAIIDTCKKIVIDNLGHKYVKWTPYVIFLLSYLFVSNMLALFGLKETTTSYTVPLTLGLITWVTSIVLSIKYQKMAYLKSFLIGVKIKGKHFYFMVNPFSIIGKITPLISLTFRIWGNIIAGSIIYSVLFWACSQLPAAYPEIGIILIGGVLVMPFMLAYLTLFTGAVQAYVFVLLTVTYWSLGIYGDEGIDTSKEVAVESELTLNPTKELKSNNIQQ